MTTCCTPKTSVLGNVEWTSVADASGAILRRATAGALVHDTRLELSYDWERGEYELGSTVVALEPAF